MARKNISENEYLESVIGASVTVEGDLISDGDLRVEGTVNGKVSTTRNLTVGSQARIQADITAQNASIAGAVEGNIRVSDTLRIEETGKILGNIFCKNLGVEEGAYFSGQCEMDRKAEEIESTRIEVSDDEEEEEEE